MRYPQFITATLILLVTHCSSAYQKILGANRLYLGNITQTFLSMHSTAYRVDDLIQEMRKDGPDPLLMADNIEGAIEFKEMFSD